MKNSEFKILLIVLLSFFMSHTATAQFYRQRNGASHILKYGIGATVQNDTLKVGKKNKTVNKKKKTAAKKKRKSVAAKSKVRKSKDSVKYTGVKYKPGDRVIMRGDSGADVKSVAKMLVERLFLDEYDIIYTQDGGVLYDGAIIKAVRSFQKVSGLYEDGMVTLHTLKALRKKE